MKERNIESAKNREQKFNIEKENSQSDLGLLKIKSLEYDDVLYNSAKNIKNDILFFKNDFLKEIKKFKTELIEEAKQDKQYMNETLEKFSSKIERFDKKIVELSNLIVTDKAIREKVEEIIEFKEKAKETMMTDGIKINNLEKDFYENIYRIDNILKDTVLNSKIIGGIAKFNTFFDFMSNIIDEISRLNAFKDKANIEFNNYRTKLDNYTNKTKLKIENSEKELKLYADKLAKKGDFKREELGKECNNRLNEMKLQNLTFAENINKIKEQILSKVDNVVSIKKELFDKIEEQNNLIKKHNSKILKFFEGYKEEFYNIKKKYMEICNHIKYKGDLKNIDFDINKTARKASIKQKKNSKQFKRLETLNILTINKIQFDNGLFTEHKNNDLKNLKSNLRTSVNYENKRRNSGRISLENNIINSPFNKFNDSKLNRINATKSVINPFKLLNNSNNNSSNSKQSIIKEEKDIIEFPEKKENNFPNDNNPLSRENLIIKEDLNDIIKKSKTFNKYNNSNIVENKSLFNIQNTKKETQKEEKNKNTVQKVQKINYKSNGSINTNNKRNNILNKSPVPNKISISIDGVNNFEFFVKSKDNDNLEKEITKNVKTIINKDKLLNKNNGYPKIVTNNGERIIISTRPLSSKKFITYTNQNVLALNKCVKKLYGNKNPIKSGTKSKILEEDNELEYDLSIKNNYQFFTKK